MTKDIRATLAKLTLADILEVLWLDIDTIDGQGVSVEAVVACEPMLCTSWGKYSALTDDHLVLIQNEFNDIKGSPDYIRIPPGCIKRVTLLAKGNNAKAAKSRTGRNRPGKKPKRSR